MAGGVNVYDRTTQNGSRLDSWKAIAAYLKKDVRTVIRWEKERHLPVHRMPGKKRSAVFAWTSEIDSWLGGVAADLPVGDGFTEAMVGAEQANSSVLLADTPHPTAARERQYRKWWVVPAISVISLSAAAIAVRPWEQPVHPRLGNGVQLTSDVREKYDLVASRSALYFDSFGGGAETVTRIDQNGDKQTFQPFANQTFALLDVSPNEAEMLFVVGGRLGCEGPLWIVPTDGGRPRRLADLSASAAAWSPDGERLAYLTGRNLCVAKSHVAEQHRVITLPFRGFGLRWSPDGRRLRFFLEEHLYTARLWEVDSDGSIQKVLPGFSRTDEDGESSGCWTPNGTFFVFAAFHGGRADLWAIPERKHWLDWRHRDPFHLTMGSAASEPLMSKDGRKLFALVRAPERGDLMRYDPVSHQFVSYPDQAGLSAAHTSFSPDGKEIAYVTYPQMALWKMKADGTGQKMLTDRAVLPQWSPGGRRIAFMLHSDDPRHPTKVRLISADGGRPEQPVASPEWQGVPTWTADGSGLIYGENGPTFPIRESCSIHLYDLKSGKTTSLPGTTGLWTARACPTGRYIAAVTRDNRRLVLYDLGTSNWTELATFPDSEIGANPTWSRDGKFIYVDAPGSPDPAIYRISVPGRRSKRVADLKGIQRAHGNIGVWIGLTPDNLPLILRSVQSNQVWAWDWLAP